MAIFRFSVSTNRVGSTREDIIEIPDEELEGLSEEGKDDYIYDYYFKDWLEENVSYFWEEEEL